MRPLTRGDISLSGFLPSQMNLSRLSADLAAIFLSLAAAFLWASCTGADDGAPKEGTAAAASACQDAASSPTCDAQFSDDGSPASWRASASRSEKIGRVQNGESIALTLSRMGLPPQESNAAIRALESAGFDCKKSRPGDQIRIIFDGGTGEEAPWGLEYLTSLTRRWSVTRNADGSYSASEKKAAVTREEAIVDISIESSLYEAIRASGEEPSLAMEIADVFAWDIDFYRDVRRGDRLRVIVEKELLRGQFLSYGNIIGVRYKGGLVGDKSYLRYRTQKGSDGYFGEEGQNAKKAFLKSPLKFTFITSNFGMRNHPVLGFTKAHRGVDLRAAVGTPVWCVADGTVTKAVINDHAAGTYLAVRHANGIETSYLHLSKIAPGIRAGSRVQQKQVIAYSGNTGRSTGPHLHYGMKRGNEYLNPFSQSFPRADPLSKDELARFKKETAAAWNVLQAMPEAPARAASSSEGAE